MTLPPQLSAVIRHPEPPKAVVDKSRSLLGAARWLWPQQASYDCFNLFARYERDLELEVVPSELWAAISADQSYQLFVNDRMVCRGPARGYQARWPFDVVDLAPFLKRGANRILARVFSAGESSFAYIFAGFSGFIFAAEWDGGKLLSDASWTAYLENANRRFTKKASTQLFRQEHIDLRKLTGKGALRACPHLSMTSSFGEPWSDMAHRGIPMLHESIFAEGALIGRAEGNCREDWPEVDDVVALRHAEGLAHQPVSRQAFSPVSAAGVGAARYESFLIDFGRVVFGALEVTAENAPGGECLDILYAETIREESLELELELDGWNHIALGSRLILDQGPCQYRFYHPYGFRYAVITVRNCPRPLAFSVTLHTTGYPVERQARFSHSDQKLEDIWQACAYTQEICASDAFVDTPWREQAQWWGDARYQGEHLHWLMEDSRLYARGIEIVGTQRTADGLTYGLAPSLAHGCVLPDFSLAWVMTIWEHYWQTGDLKCFRQEKKGIQSVLGYFRNHYDARYSLIRSDPRYWLFLDWAPVFKGAYPAILSFLLARALQTTAALARLDGDFIWEKELNAWIDELSRGLKSLRRSDGLFADGRDEKGVTTELLTIHGQALAVITGLEKNPDRSWIEKALLPALGTGPTDLVRTNLHWYSELFELLATRGYQQEVIDCIRRVWGPMAEFGTTSERNDFIPGRHSRSHAWTAHPLVHLMRVLGGVRQTGPGWQSATIDPSFIGDHCKISVPTPFGAFSTAWTKGASGIELECHIPEGMKVYGSFSDQPKAPLPAGKNTWRIRAASNL